MSEPVLEYTLQGPGRESLVVAADGTVDYLVSAAAHPDWADRAGLYRTSVSSADQDRVRRLAAELVRREPRTRGRTGPVVRAVAGGSEAVHPLDGGDEAAGLLSELIETARAHPWAVVSLAAEVVNGTDVRVRLAATGPEPVELRLDRTGCVVSVRVPLGVGPAWTPLWRSDAGSRLRLVAEPGGFLDGVNAPATLLPGAVARTVLAGALTDRPAEADAASVEVSGWLSLTSPAVGDEDDLFGEAAPAETPFRLRSGAFPLT